MTAVLWVIGILAVLVVIARLRSLLAPSAFPPWLTPILVWPGRNRERILERAGLRPGERVLEIGPGAGWITERAVERLGDSGRLVCLDLQSEMLRKVRHRLGARTPALVQASGSRLPFRDGAFDRAFLIHVLGEIPDKPAAVAELHRVIRSGGELAVEEGLPDPDYIRTAVLGELVSSAGFRTGERFGGPTTRSVSAVPDQGPACSRRMRRTSSMVAGPPCAEWPERTIFSDWTPETWALV